MALPFEMIDEVLCRLPVKPLLRFRCMSKGWCSLIDSNAFAKKQLKTSLDCNAGVGVLIAKLANGGDKRFYLAGFDSLEDESPCVVQIDDPFKSFLSDVLIVGASNGLMCVFKGKQKDIFLLNLTTRKYRKIASAPPEFPSSFSWNEKHLCGFGYDEVNDDFKVVKIAQCYVQFRGLIAMVYSLKTNAWTRIQEVPSSIRFTEIRGLFARGSLHWMAKEDQINGKDVIVGFNLELQQFKKVPLPPIESTLANSRNRILVDVGGYLSVLDCKDNDMDVWLMNYPGAVRTWHKALSRKNSEVVGTFRFTKPVAFSRSGEDLLILERNDFATKLMWYNLDQKTVKNVGIRGIPVHFTLFLYTESLLQLSEDNLLQQKPSKNNQRNIFLSHL
ncbi:hypothetical protein ACET3Z_008968 [Daucus carota]